MNIKKIIKITFYKNIIFLVSSSCNLKFGLSIHNAKKCTDLIHLLLLLFPHSPQRQD